MLRPVASGRQAAAQIDSAPQHRQPLTRHKRVISRRLRTVLPCAAQCLLTAKTTLAMDPPTPPSHRPADRPAHGIGQRGAGPSVRRSPHGLGAFPYPARRRPRFRRLSRSDQGWFPSRQHLRSRRADLSGRGWAMEPARPAHHSRAECGPADRPAGERRADRHENQAQAWKDC